MSSSSVPPIAFEQILEKIADISLRIQQLSDIDEIFTCAVEQSRVILRCDRVLIYQFAQTGQGVVLASSGVDVISPSSLAQWIERCDCQPQYLSRYHQRQTYAIADIYTDELQPADLALAAQLPVSASLGGPIFCGDRVWGLLIAHQCQQARSWQSLDHQLLQQIALQLGIALQQHQLKLDSEQRINYLSPPNELQHQLIADDQTEMIARFSSENLLLFVNEAYCRYFGVNREDVIGKSYQPVIYPPDQEIVAQQLQRLSAAHPTITIENRVVNAQGEICWTQWVNRRLTHEPGGAVEFQSVGRDITDLKQTEIELRAVRDQFRIVQELSLDAFTILKSIRDPTGQIVDFEWTYVNPKAAEALKHPIAELVGQRLLAVLPGNQENSELFRQYVRVVETGQPHDLELFYNAEGITGWFRNMTVKLEDGVAISFSDITQRKETEKALQASTEQLQKAVAELEQLNQVKDEFLSTVSHELRTPMTNIRMSIRMLELSLSRLADQQKHPKINQYLQILSHECDREINLINDLLDLQRLESGQKKITLELIDFYQWLVMFVRPFQERTQARQQELELELPPTQAAEIYYDLKSLERIVGELLNNACKYTPPKHKIILTAQQTLDQLEIQVSNFGVEIPAPALPHIFDRFYRVPSGDPWQQGGTGLGLALVKKLVEHLNGTIQVDSHSGRTCFHLTLAIPQDAPHN